MSELNNLIQANIRVKNYFNHIFYCYTNNLSVFNLSERELNQIGKLPIKYLIEKIPVDFIQKNCLVILFISIFLYFYIIYSS